MASPGHLLYALGLLLCAAVTLRLSAAPASTQKPIIGKKAPGPSWAPPATAPGRASGLGKTGEGGALRAPGAAGEPRRGAVCIPPKPRRCLGGFTGL